MSGIIYYRLSPVNYHQNMIGYDYTKYTSITGNEIDSNFHFLEGNDVYSFQMNGHNLELVRVNGNIDSVKLTPYTTSCGLTISNENEIGINVKELGAISCFNNEIYTSIGCGLTVVTEEEESCTNFNNFLIRMLGNNRALQYITGQIKINDQFYGGRTVISACDVPDCTRDQFYNDYLQYISNGFIKIDVCGITCDENDNAKINVDSDTIKLEDCQLKVNYGCGLTIHDTETEQDYINFLSDNWHRLVVDPETDKLECYLDGTLAVGDSNLHYGEKSGVTGRLYTNDQFYSQFNFQTTLNVDLTENGGLICTNEGISVDYGCGLEVKSNATLEGFKDFLSKFFQYTATQLAGITEENWKEDTHYNSYMECFNSGALSVSLHNNGGLFCIGGKIGINLGCGLEIETLTPSCGDGSTTTDDSYYAFLYNNWEILTGDSTQGNAASYWGGTHQVGCEFFGHNQCSGTTCNQCDIWQDDQFFCDYVSYINGGRLKVKLGSGIYCDNDGITTTQPQQNS